MKTYDYDFSWIEKSLREATNPELFKRENLEWWLSHIPYGLVYWFDFEKGQQIFDSNGQLITDIDEYWRQRHEFEKYLVKRYSKCQKLRSLKIRLKNLGSRLMGIFSH